MNSVEVTLEEQIQIASETQHAGMVQGCLCKLPRLNATARCTCQTTCQIHVKFHKTKINAQTQTHPVIFLPGQG